MSGDTGAIINGEELGKSRIAGNASNSVNTANNYKTGKKESDWKTNTVQIVAKGVIGAAVGVAGGMVLVTAAAAVEGAILSWALFAKVLGIAGAAGGVSHGVVSQTRKNR